MKLLKCKHTPEISGQQARVQAEADLERMRAETPKWEALHDDIHDIRVKNHLAELFKKSTKGDP